MKANKSLDDILELTREIALKELAPGAQQVDAEGRWPERQLRSLQEAGLGGLVISAELGGHGHGLSAVAKVCEVLGQHCGSTAMCFGMHLVGSAMLAAKATERQREQYLRPIARGEHLTTLSLSEPGTGSHFYIPEAQLTKQENGDYRLNGTKSFVTNGGYADSYVVSAVIPDPAALVGHFSCVVIPNEDPAIEWQAPWDGLGMRGNASRNVEISDLKVPKKDLLGEPGDQIWYVFEVVAPYFLTAMAGTYLGIAGAAVGEATAYLKDRTHSHSGASLAKQPVLQHRLGTLWARVESARQLIYSAGAKGDAGAPDALLSLLSAKGEVAGCVVDVVNEAMTLMGGKAYGRNGKLARLLRDARASHVMAPTTDLLRTWAGRALLDEPMLGD
ncbi:acyl-CoA dehydrogenase family protein [soil metagenome]